MTATTPPTVTASIRSDDGKSRGVFDAAPYLATATDARIRVLACRGWGKCDAADEVAYSLGNDDAVRAVFSHVRGVGPAGADDRIIGFEVVVNEQEGMSWLRLHRWYLYLELYHLTEEARAVKARRPIRPELARALAAMADE